MTQERLNDIERMYDESIARNGNWFLTLELGREILEALRSSALPFHTAEEFPDNREEEVLIVRNGKVRVGRAMNLYNQTQNPSDPDAPYYPKFPYRWKQGTDGWISYADLIAAFTSWQQGRRV